MIYVDPLMNHGWVLRSHHVQNCHLFTDGDLEELHAVAARIGMQRRWFQTGSMIPHYDLVTSKRGLAVEHGAISICVAVAGKLFMAIRRHGLPLAAEERMRAFLLGSRSRLKFAGVQDARQVAFAFRQLLTLDPEAPALFLRTQEECNCNRADDGHALNCPQRLNALLDYLDSESFL